LSLQIRDVNSRDLPQLLSLNNAHAEELSFLTFETMDRLLGLAHYARVVGDVEAFCIALDHTAEYDNPNFLWFSARYDRFIYIDRIGVSKDARGKGLARGLYLDLIDAALGGNYKLLCCEVHVYPPNPSSNAFHAGFGFVKTWCAHLSDRNKTVNYFVLDLNGAGSRSISRRPRLPFPT